MSTQKLQIIGNLVKTDDTLTQIGKAADAKATGDAIKQLQVNIDEVAGLVGGADVEYYTEEEIDSMVADLNAAIDSKSDENHVHNNLYYTETEIDDKIDTIQLNIDSKVDKVDGMGLSANDYTTAEKDKLKTVEANANFYEHPTHTSHNSGLYKITVDDSGHVSGATLVEKGDIMDLGIPAQDTTYDEEISDLNDRIDGVENGINTTNETLKGVTQDFESYKTTNNEAVSTNASGIEANKTAIEAIQSNYLTLTDKTQLEDDISKVSGKATANAAAIEVLNGEGDGSVKKSIDNAFNEFAANVTNDDVINTYKELIDYAAAHSSEFTELVGEVDTINTHLGEVETDLFDYKTVVSEQFTGVNDTIDSHLNNLDNPHIVTKEQIGLANVDDTSDLEKPISNATQAALDEKADYEHIHDDATTTTSGFMSADDKAQLLDLQIKVGDMAVSDQITEAIAEYINTSGNAVYVQNDEPLDAADGALWVDLDDEGSVENGGGHFSIDGIVRYDTPQMLDRTQKNLTRNNTGSVGFDDIYKTEATFNFTWDGNINGKDTITIGNSVYCKVSDSSPDFYSIYGAMSETTNGETDSLLQAHLGFYSAGCGIVVEKAGRCVFLDRVDDGEFTAPSTGVYFLCSDNNTDAYQKSLSLSANGTVTLTYTWDGNKKGKDTFEYNAFPYYKISDDVFDFKMISGCSLKTTNSESYTYNFYNGVNCYNVGSAIIVTKAGLCELAVNNFDEYSLQFTAPSTGIYFWGFDYDSYDTELNLIINGKHGIYLNSESNNSFTIGIADNGVITTEDESGVIVEMTTKSYVNEQIATINETINNIDIETDTTLAVSGKAADAKVTGDAISNLNNIVGDSPIPEQIAAAIEEALVEVYVQDDVPENAPDGSIWVDLDADGAPTTSGKTTANVYVIDARTNDMTTVDFSQYKINDVIVVTVS